MSRAFSELQAFTGQTMDQDPEYLGDAEGVEFELNDLNDPVPEGLPTPASYRMFIMPVGIKRKTSGGIILPDESIDAQLWLNCLGRVAKLGPGCFKHPNYAALGMTDADFPKVGDLILYSARAPLRFTFRSTRIIVINDDHWFAKDVTPEQAAQFKFYV